MRILAALPGVCLLASVAVPAQHPSDKFVDGQSVISVSSLGQHPLSKKAHELLKKGMREYFRQDYAQALDLLRKALAQEPKSSALENDLGVVYSLLGKDKEAQGAFELASKADSGSAVSFINLSAVSFNIYEYPISEQAARRALRIDPRSPQAQVMLGLAEVAQDHWTNEARRYLEENREQYHQAKIVLEHWPKANDPDHTTAPRVRGAGPGALAGSYGQVRRTERPALTEK